MGLCMNPKNGKNELRNANSTIEASKILIFIKGFRDKFGTQLFLLRGRKYRSLKKSRHLEICGREGTTKSEAGLSAEYFKK